MNPRHFFVFLSLGLLVSGCVPGTLFYHSAPSELPATRREMKTAGFWISRQASPDKIIMDRDRINEFNLHVQGQLGLTADLLSLAEISGGKLIQEWTDTVAKLKQRNLFRSDGRKAQDAFFDELGDQMVRVSIPQKIKPTFGFIVHYADERVLPTAEPLYAKAGDIDFDELQNSTLDVGTPVAYLSSSADGQWYYVKSALSSGWIQKDNVAFTDLEALKEYTQDRNFAVVIAPKADLFLDRDMTQYYDYARMGSRFRIEAGPLDNGAFSVRIPVLGQDGSISFKEGFLRQGEVNEGYLPYTARNIIEQAFKLLNAPYGWGGMYGEQDCSAFLDEVFATVGIMLPRNSSDQRQVGVLSAKFDENTSAEEKLKALAQAPGGSTVLGLRGHIMLYLGTFEDRPYAIHAVWAYREPAGSKDKIRVINRVAVTDLSLGEGSQNGSLLKRIKEVLLVQ